MVGKNLGRGAFTMNGYLSAPFDLLNVEDLDVLEQARALSDRLLVGVWSDELVERVYGRPPVVGLDERMALLRRLRGVEDVLVHDDVDPVALTDTDEDLRLFVVADRPADDLDAWADHDVELLPVRRTTASLALRRALALRVPAELADAAVA